MTADKIAFALRWEQSAGGARMLTSAALSVSVEGDTIWPVEGAAHIALDFQADDLLAHITEFWKPLLLRQTYPVGAQPERPSLLRVEAERRWEGQPASVAEREGEIVSAFEEAHDLSRCFAGQFDLPPLWLMREGSRMIVETRSGVRRIDFAVAHKALTRVGNQIAERLEKSADTKWSELLAAWHARNKGDPTALLAWSASLDRNVAQTFIREGLLSAPTTVADAANDNDELRVAARMSSALPPDQIRQIINLVSGFKKRHSSALDDLAERTLAYISQNFARHRPYEQGEAAASFVRERLGLASVQFVDIFAEVEKFGVAVHPKDVEPATLFALAVWGDRHGPAVLVNVRGLKPAHGNVRRNAAARVTLAHELCHLLLDRGHALSSVEVLNSRMPLDIERRAKAFAGELLLPGRVAADVWFRAKTPHSTSSVDAVLQTLRRTYGVTQSVAAWKLEHGLHYHDIDLRSLLDAVAPHR